MTLRIVCSTSLRIVLPALATIVRVSTFSASFDDQVKAGYWPCPNV
jgi:hypothetical protein